LSTNRTMVTVATDRLRSNDTKSNADENKGVGTTRVIGIVTVTNLQTTVAMTRAERTEKSLRTRKVAKSK